MAAEYQDDPVENEKRKTMYFWREDFELMNAVASGAAATPAWADYAAFCLNVERGLRREAFARLTSFISMLERAPFEERKHFTSWLLHRTYRREGRHKLTPHPLKICIIEPTLLEWTIVEPLNPEPHLWLGGYDHLKQALDLEPSDQRARKELIIEVLSQVSNDAHELPIGYLGAPEQDLEVLTEAEELLLGLSNLEERSAYALEIRDVRRSIEEYLRKR